MIKVALTGGIGSGKSEVERLLAARGAVVIDADRLAREVVEPGTPGLAAVLEEFGPAVRALTARWTGPRSRRSCSRTPAPGAGSRRSCTRWSGHARDELLDAGRARRRRWSSTACRCWSRTASRGGYDLVVVVDAPDEVRLDRLVRLRGMTEADATARMAAQAPREERLAAADLVVRNDGTLAELAERVEAVWAELSARRQRP